MFERFSSEARGAVTAAQDVARATASRAIDTRHLLVALAEGAAGPDSATAALREVGIEPDRLAGALRSELTADGLDSEALGSLGIDLTAVRRRTDEVFGAGALDHAGRSPGHIPFTRDAKKALELALREALRLKQKPIDVRHLLLGIIRAECPGRDALLERGVHLEALRRALDEGGEPGARSA